MVTDDELPLNLSTKSRRHSSIWSPGSLCEQERSRSPSADERVVSSIGYGIKSEENLSHEDQWRNYQRNKLSWDSADDIKPHKIPACVGSNGERTFQVSNANLNILYYNNQDACESIPCDYSILFHMNYN